MRLRLSDRGLALIKRSEGFRAHAYKPVRAELYWTIGYGHSGRDVKPTDYITRKQGDRLLRGDVRWAEDAVNRLVRTNINQNRFDALVSLCFNIGAAAFASSTVLRMTNARRFRLAALAFALWVRGANGVRLAGLVARRAREARLYLRRVS